MLRLSIRLIGLLVSLALLLPASARPGLALDEPGARPRAVSVDASRQETGPADSPEAQPQAADVPAQPVPGLLRYGLDLYPGAMDGSWYYPLQQVKYLGFDYAQFYLSWRTVEPARGQLDLSWVSQFVDQANYSGVRPVLRIYDPPAWAESAAIDPSPVVASDLANFVTTLVRIYGRRVAGYVILNEPNLSSEWGNRPPDPAAYVQLLQTVFRAAKEANPYAVIVSAGLAPTQGGVGAMSDISYLSGMYGAGLKGACDVVGMSGIGFGSAPDDTSDSNGYNFSRLATLRQVMVNNGDASKRAWALEVGWVVDTPADLGTFNPWKVSEAQQAQYLRRAMQKAAAEWPWLDALFIWNLDFRWDFSTWSQPEKPSFAVLGRQAFNCISLQYAFYSCGSALPMRTFLPSVVR